MLKFVTFWYDTNWYDEAESWKVGISIDQRCNILHKYFYNSHLSTLSSIIVAVLIIVNSLSVIINSPNFRIYQSICRFMLTWDCELFSRPNWRIPFVRIYGLVVDRSPLGRIYDTGARTRWHVSIVSLVQRFVL